MGELWRDLVDLLRRRPLLWIPVLLADILAYLLNLGRLGLLRALVLHQTAQRSALGGAVLHAPLSPSAMQSTTVLALLLSWLVYFVRILIFSGAFIATAALVWAYLNREQRPARLIGPWLARHWGGMLELAVRALAVYAAAALLFSWLSSFLIRHGNTTALRNPWTGLALGLVVLLLLAILLAPAALRVLTGKAPERGTAAIAQQFAAILAVVIALLAMFVGQNSREMVHVPPAVRYPLEIIGSLVVALPYVLLFTGLALLARRLAQEATE